MILSGFYSKESTPRANEYLTNMSQRQLECHHSISPQLSLASTSEPLSDEAGVFTILGSHYWGNTSSNNTSNTGNPAERLKHSYLEKGLSFIDDLRGQFVCAIYDKAKSRLVIALDKLGQQHLYYTNTSNGIVFSTDAQALQQHPDISAEISSQGLYHYFYFHMIPAPGTIYSGIEKLNGGELLVYENGIINKKTYWMPGFSETSINSQEKSGTEMLDIIERSVKRHADCDNVGSFLSGGLDSSTVSGMLAKACPNKANTFSIGFNAEGYDEIEYARIASQHFKTKQHEYYVTPEDVAEKVHEIAAFYDEPFGNSSALPAYFCAKMAKENGVTTLLAGDGGDEIFAGNERYAKQGIFEAYNKIPAVFRTLLLEPTLHNSLTARIPIIKKAHSYITQAKTPLPDRLEYYNYLHMHQATEIFTPDFLNTINQETPIDLLRQTYQQPSDASPLNRMLYLDWKRTLHDNDLVKVNRMCQMAGINVVYPLLDDELLEFSCSIPSNLKMKDNHLRWFFKESVKDFLPKKIINKRKQGFGLPFGVWTSTNPRLKSIAYEALEDLKKRDIFLPSFIDNTIRMHQSVHAKYYGELVWVLMMLELWLASH